jgi:hypothetical protein
MRQLLAAFALVLATITAPLAQVSVNIGINLGAYPQLVRVPGYPVYYAPQVNSNYFFYDGMYWVYAYDNWYASTWYNGPWTLVAPDFVPLYVLREPVRYYRRAPTYFRGWRSDAPPRWGDHWGNTWYDNHRGWDTWNRSAVPAPAPLPVYQRQYSGNRYPRADQQVTLQTQHYRYAPRDAAVQRQYETRQSVNAPAPPAGSTRPASSPRSQQQVARPPQSQQSRTPSTEQAAHPPTAQQARPANNQHSARPPAAQQPHPDNAQQSRPSHGPPPVRAQSQRPPATPPAEGSATAPQARAPQPNIERAAQAPNQASRGNNQGNGQGSEQHGNGRGAPPGQDKKGD